MRNLCEIYVLSLKSRKVVGHTRGRVVLADRRRSCMQLRFTVVLLAILTMPSMAHEALDAKWEHIKHKFVGGPYAGAGGMAVGSGSVGVEEFVDDAEAIRAIRLFPSVMKSFGG